MKRTLILIAMVAFATAAVSAEGKSVVLMNGRLHFTVPSGWVDLQRQTRETSDIVAFEIPNPAAAGTKDSANVSVVANWSLGERNIERFSEGPLASLRQKPGTVVVNDVNNTDGSRTVLSRSQQGSTPYLVIDTFGFGGGAHVWCRAAYPLLQGTAEQWNSDVVRDYNALVAGISVDGNAVFASPGASK
jgi:hypothetical protein